MEFKRYFALLRYNGEKNGDWFLSMSRLDAAKYFANKKKIPLKEWLKIYKVTK